MTDVRQEKGAKEPPKQGVAKQFGDKRAPTGRFACGALGHQKAKCPHGTKKQPNQAPSNANNSWSARVATEGFKGAHSELQPVTLECLNSQIGAILDMGAEITVLRQSAVPAESVKPHGTIGLVSAFGEKVSARLAVVPLNILRETGVFAQIREAVLALCALTDKPQPHGAILQASWGSDATSDELPTSSAATTPTTRRRAAST
ncbi:hypothetical protein HPB48_018098 [Haemaphysalis longicornis]|uniref:Peptidase A2 domain-containing protein n=1 Tax=Haemaphysalis longicornis TaxID=44386 RepID=A0A9J6GW09_HAELO|nr:hypothetical protein HPB48_018098 [Haemaphysalis longicornis]